jgi:hypothetical protein
MLCRRALGALRAASTMPLPLQRGALRFSFSCSRVTSTNVCTGIRGFSAPAASDPKSDKAEKTNPKPAILKLGKKDASSKRRGLDEARVDALIQSIQQLRAVAEKNGAEREASSKKLCDLIGTLNKNLEISNIELEKRPRRWSWPISKGEAVAIVMFWIAFIGLLYC